MYIQLSVLDIQKNKVLVDVWKIISSAHKGQTRKGINQNGILPCYTAHLFRVMEITANALGDPHTVIKNDKLLPFLTSALMHDMIEDTSINTPEKLTNILTPIIGYHQSTKIAEIVSELSNPANGFEGKTKEEQDKNKKEWQVKHAQTMSFPAKLIKMSDQIANIIDVVDLDMSKQKKQAWSREKKIFYINKALAVCNACLYGTQNLSLVQKQVFISLNNFATLAGDYALFKIKNPQYTDLDFFKELNIKNRKNFKKHNLIILNTNERIKE